MKKVFAAFLCIALCFGLMGSAVAQTVFFGRDQYAPLQWQVLQSTGEYTKLLSVDCIACRPFGASSDWATGSLRSWLNYEYLYDAFSYEERNAMCYVEGDLIRLPSVWDMTNPEYGFASSTEAQDRSRSARGNAAAVSSGLGVSDRGYCSYYTLTPCDRTSVYQIGSAGNVGVAGVDSDDVGVRIMIVVRTDALHSGS